jgi:hypothetical protein
MKLADAIRFVSRRPSGAARVQFPRVDGCPKCGGARSVTLRLRDGEFIAVDPELAREVRLIAQGYQLAINEQRANGGAFRGHDPHDGGPDEWQYVEEVQSCNCTCGADQK